ncbi:hypothetical protein HanRHA438_Chr08g0333581 [Helianthus annuus]|nr:hypothetical protein HanRHA438_Chr08g0333581 [Helianthus annuus]
MLKIIKILKILNQKLYLFPVPLQRKKKKKLSGNSLTRSFLLKNKSLRRLCLEPKRKQELAINAKKLVTSPGTVQWQPT